MTPHEKIAAVYAKLHENRFEHVEQARRARDMQERLAEFEEALNKTEELVKLRLREVLS